MMSNVCLADTEENEGDWSISNDEQASQSTKISEAFAYPDMSWSATVSGVVVDKCKYCAAMLKV